MRNGLRHFQCLSPVRLRYTRPASFIHRQIHPQNIKSCLLIDHEPRIFSLYKFEIVPVAIKLVVIVIVAFGLVERYTQGYAGPGGNPGHALPGFGVPEDLHVPGKELGGPVFHLGRHAYGCAVVFGCQSSAARGDDLVGKVESGSYVTR